MKVNPSEHYGSNYFYPAHKEYVDEFGVKRKYYGPSKEWHGFGYIAQWIKEEFNPESILDIGCSAGSFISYARKLGIRCKGVDISHYAIENCIDGAKGCVEVSDITKHNPPFSGFNIVTAMDLMEHIYYSDLDNVMRYIKSSLIKNGIVFACIATTRNSNEEWIHTSKDDEVPASKRWLAVSGHVTVQPMTFWIKKFESTGFETLYSSMAKFQIWKEYKSDLKGLESWSIRNIYIGAKI